MDIPVHVVDSRPHTAHTFDEEHLDQLRPLTNDTQSRSYRAKKSFLEDMRRAFSRRDRQQKCGPAPIIVPQWDNRSKTVVDEKSWPADEKTPVDSPPRKMNQMMTRQRSTSNGAGGKLAGTGLQRSMSKREKVANAIANPDQLFKADPMSPPPESKFNPNPNGKIMRTFFSNNLDMAPTTPAYITSTYKLPHAELPLFSPHLVSQKVAVELPAGYVIRPLCRADYNRGYMDCMRVLAKTGHVDEAAWERRCEWLRAMGESYFIVVVLDPDEIVVATGTLVVERKFLHNLGLVGRIEDIAVSRSQKGKKMGLRVLEALMYVSVQAGCYKTIVNCSEANEAFHAQAGFVKDGSQMVLTHSRKVAGEKD